MLNSTPCKRKITLVAAKLIASLLMDWPHHKIVLSYLMDYSCRLSQWRYQKLWWVAKTVGLVAWKLFLFGDKSTPPWHQSVYTQIFLLLWYTFSSLDAFSYRQSQSNITEYSSDSSWCSGRFPCLCTLESICSENEFSLLWNEVKQFAEKHKIDRLHFPTS